MFDRFFAFSVLALGLLVSGCSTYVENQASYAFDPIYPEAHMPEDHGAPTGAIYMASKGGLFATDRRAREVGDILTVSRQKLLRQRNHRPQPQLRLMLLMLIFRSAYQIFLPVALTRERIR